MSANQQALLASSGSVQSVTELFCSTSAGVVVYGWNNGITGKITTTGGPTSLNCDHVAVSPSGASVAVSRSTSPFVEVYPWTGTNYGTKFSDPSSLPSIGSGCIEFHPSGNYIVFRSSGDNFYKAFNWSDSTGFGSQLTSSVSSGSSTTDLRFSPDGNYAVYGMSASPYIEVYPFSSSGFGTRVSNPSTLPTGATTCVFSPSGNTVFASIRTIGSDDLLWAYNWSAGFGTRYANVTVTNLADNNSIDAKSTDVVVSGSGNPYIQARPYTEGSSVGAAYSNPASGVGSSSSICRFSQDGNYVVVGSNSTPYIHVYPFSSGFGTKHSNPSTLPTAAVSMLAFKPTI